MTQNENTLNAHKVELEQSMQTLETEVADIKDDMADIKEGMIAVKNVIQKLSVAIIRNDHEEGN